VFSPDTEGQREAMKRTSELVSMPDRDLKFEVRDESGIVRVQVIDTKKTVSNGLYRPSP